MASARCQSGQAGCRVLDPECLSAGDGVVTLAISVCSTESVHTKGSGQFREGRPGEGWPGDDGRQASSTVQTHYEGTLINRLKFSQFLQAPASLPEFPGITGQTWTNYRLVGT